MFDAKYNLFYLYIFVTLATNMFNYFYMVWQLFFKRIQHFDSFFDRFVIHRIKNRKCGLQAVTYRYFFATLFHSLFFAFGIASDVAPL